MVLSVTIDPSDSATIPRCMSLQTVGVKTLTTWSAKLAVETLAISNAKLATLATSSDDRADFDNIKTEFGLETQEDTFTLVSV